MGKISDALDKFSRERREAEQQPHVARMPLNQSDYDALVNYDRETGHLLKYDRGNGLLDGRRIELLKEQGTIQRLLDNELIYPGGKLTNRGLDEARRLEVLKIAKPESDGHPHVAGLPEKRGAEVKHYKPEKASEPAPEASAPMTSALKSAEEPPQAPPKPLTLLTAPMPMSPAAVKDTAVDDGTGHPESTPWPALGDDRLRVLPGSMEYQERAIDPKLVALHSPHSYEAEQFKILRTNILYPVAGDPPQSILVTSTGPEEGKTFAAANLAISIALNVNKHVLLIDADLRNPQLHRRFGFGNVAGLSNYLLDGRPLTSLLLKTRVEKLTLLSSGPPPANPSELISSERMANLLAEVKARYSDRLIVIDAPPPRMAAETAVIARQVDGILIVVRYGRTPKEELAHLIESVGKKKILGSLVNFTETEESRYYGYKYGNYRKNDKKTSSRRVATSS